MDSVFFFASKIIWAIVSPDSLIVILVVGAWLAMIAGWTRLSRRLLAVCALVVLLIALLPVGEWLIAPLENRFEANTALPLDADGVIVLSGAIDPVRSEIWGQVDSEEAGGPEDLLDLRPEVEHHVGVHEDVDDAGVKKACADEPPPLSCVEDREALLRSEDL